MLSKKNGADSSAKSAPKREWQSKNVDGRDSVRKSHGHHIPPAKGMGERALLLLGLFNLLTAADEVRNADAQHRATSDPSERHAVETGEREAGALLVLDGDGNPGRGNFFIELRSDHIRVGGLRRVLSVRRSSHCM